LLAVLALVFQSLVFAGHVHRPAFAWAAAITADNGAPGVRPDHGPLPERPGDACDICAVLHLAGVAVESAPPVLTAPLFFPRRQSASLAAAPVIAASRHFLAQSRAPPTV
jgi:hypothetical protein